jgi:hypothetical protein
MFDRISINYEDQMKHSTCCPQGIRVKYNEKEDTKMMFDRISINYED